MGVLINFLCCLTFLLVTSFFLIAIEPCKCQDACPNHDRLQHKNTLEFLSTTNSYFRKKSNSYNYICPCHWDAPSLTLSSSPSPPFSPVLREFSLHQHTSIFCQILRVWFLGLSSLCLNGCWCASYFVCPCWMSFIDLLLETVCVVSIIFKLYFP